MIVNYNPDLEESLIQGYIKTFAGEPWNEIWEHQWVLDRVRWISSVPNFIGKVAVENGEVVGALLGYTLPFKGKLNFDIVELFVLPSSQGNGVGKSLIKELEKTLPLDNGNVIHLITAKESDSETFYKKCGYERNEHLCVMAHVGNE